MTERPFSKGMLRCSIVSDKRLNSDDPARQVDLWNSVQANFFNIGASFSCESIKVAIPLVCCTC